MKKVGIMLIVLLVSSVNYAMSGLIPYPLGELTVVVIDEDSGLPIPGAHASITFIMGYGSKKDNFHKGVTDKDGKFTASDKGTRFARCVSRHEGYYESRLEYSFDPIKNSVQTKHTPWNPEVVLKLRKKINPVPMYAKRVLKNARIPALGKEIGFDLMKGDWVSPYGEGNVSDFIFEVTRDVTNNSKYEGRYKLTFANRFDGIFPYESDKKNQSKLLLPHEAPLDGYLNELIKYQKQMPGKVLATNVDENQHYYFRVRSVEKDGKLVSAMYGKIYGDFKLYTYTIVKMDQEKLPGIVFEYYLNPDKTRNTEFDPRKNLMKNFKSFEEEVKAP